MSPSPGRLPAAVCARVPGRPAPPVRRRLADDGAGDADGRHDPALAGRRAGAPLLVPVDVRRARGRARARPASSIPRDVPLEIAGLVGCAVTTGICAVWRSAAVRPGQRAAVVGCGGVGLSAVIGLAAAGAAPIVAVDVDRPGWRRPVRWARPTRSLGRLAGGDRRGGAGSDRRRRGRRDRGDRPRRGDAGRVPGHPPPRHRGASSGSPARTRWCRCRRSRSRAWSGGLSGPLYGSARPDRDFLVILDLYRRGRLPLDRLISPPAAAGADRRGVRPAAQRAARCARCST